MRTVKFSLILLFLIPLFADGYLYFSGLNFNYMGDKSNVLLSCGRFEFKKELGNFEIKIAPLYIISFSNEEYLNFTTGYDPSLSHPIIDYNSEDFRTIVLIDRAYLSFESGKFSFTLGRARYPWGKARLFSLLDVFNPYNPFSLFPQRQGADGGRVRFYFSDFSWAEAIYVRRHGKSIWGGSGFFSIGTFDFQLAGGDYYGKFVGGAFEGEIYGTGIRGEVFKKRGFPADFVLGADRQITSKVYLMLEYLKSNGSFYPDLDILTLGGTLQISALLNLQFYAMKMWPQGRGVFLTLKDSLTPNVDLNFSLLLMSSSPWPIPDFSSVSWKVYF